MEHNRVIYTRPYDAEIEYLESTGTQYIDTLKFPHNVGKWELDIQYTQYITDQINGVYATNDERFDIGMSNSVQWFIGFGTYETPYGSDLNRHKFLLDNINNQYCIDDNQYAMSHINFTTQNSYSILIANRKYFGNLSLNYFCKEKIYSSKMWDINNNLIQEIIPVRLGQVGYMYDKVSGQLLKNKGTGNFVLGPDVANPVPNIRRVFRFDNKRFVMPMPYDSKIEYLESTGTQYIDTEVIIDSETAFAGTTVDFQAVNINNGTCVIAGSVLSEGANRYKNLNLLVYNNKFYTDGAGWRFNNNVNDITLRTIATATGTAKGISRKQFLLFARYVVGLGVNINNSGCRIFSCKMYKNEILIRDFIPVRRSNVGYLYDKVSGKLFGNAGTGQFILGNDIN